VHGTEHSMQEAREKIAIKMGLTKSDMAERLPSGIQTKLSVLIQIIFQKTKI
jgi:hypothetical protein